MRQNNFESTLPESYQMVYRLDTQSAKAGIMYMVALIAFAFHLRGCVGDIYVWGLFWFKYKNSKALMRDTEPEMTMYLPMC